MKTRESVLEKVKESIATTFNLVGYGDVTENSNITTDFVADSLDMVSLVMELEKELNIAIPDAEAEINFKNKTVGDITDYLMTKIK